MTRTPDLALGMRKEHLCRKRYKTPLAGHIREDVNARIQIA